MEEEDSREVELATIAAIYPELHIDEDDSHTVSIELPISLDNPVTVLFPAATETAPPVTPGQASTLATPVVDSQSLSNLPALQVRIALPDGYPQEAPPKVALATSPPWLSHDILRKLERGAERLWEEIGHDQVVFTYIDDLQRSSEDVFGLVDGKGTLEVRPEHMLAVLDYDMKAKQRAFEKESFDCGICLDPKRGTVCHRMLDCGHVFCVQCLQDFYNNAITEGDVAAVQCLEPNCAKKREKAHNGSSRRRQKTSLNPSELLQIPLEEALVRRYVTLKHKAELESDRTTVYCPRLWCQGAARSKKHKKPRDLEFAETSEGESDAEQDSHAETGDESHDTEDKSKPMLAVCEDCGFAFCTRCGQGWHGEFEYCIPKDRKEAVTDEEKASLEYILKHTTPCPTCAAPCQKTQGCNHMRCFRCQAHFCYLCSAWLDPSNPFQHFNTLPSGEVTDCYMRLWETEAEDEGIGAAGQGRADIMRNRNIAPAQALRAARARPQRQAPTREQPQPETDQPRQVVRESNPRLAVAREGPLVLRIEGSVPQGQGRGAANQQGIPAPTRADARAANAGQRRGRGGRGRGRGGRDPGANRQDNANLPRLRNPARVDVGRNAQNAMGNEVPPLRGEGDLNPEQEAWVRQFVQLALIDQEDLLIEWDSDEDD